MIDDPEPTEEDLLREEAKKIIETPPDPLPDAADLPDEVRNGHIED
jgi:hypothetical protein